MPRKLRARLGVFRVSRLVLVRVGSRIQASLHIIPAGARNSLRPLRRGARSKAQEQNDPFAIDEDAPRIKAGTSCRTPRNVDPPGTDLRGPRAKKSTSPPRLTAARSGGKPRGSAHKTEARISALIPNDQASAALLIVRTRALEERS